MTKAQTATAVATPATSADVATHTPAPFVPKILKQVSTNLLKLRPGMTVYVKITDRMQQAKPLKKGEKTKEDGTPREPPTLIPVVNLATGEVQSIIAGSVLRDLLNDEYPSDKYVGRGFMIEVREQKAAQGGGGRRYNTYNVAEIEVPK